MAYQFITVVGFFLSLLVGAHTLYASNLPATDPDYSRLLDFIELQDLQDPLVEFGAAEEDFDHQLNRENIAYLNQDQTLLKNIRTQLNSKTLNYQLSTSSKRLLVVPESRGEYAQLFEQYCLTAVDHLLTRIHMPSPYEQIVTLMGPLPTLAEPQQPTGITAYLVHNLVDEYVEEYLFYNKDDDQRKIKIKLSNRMFDSKIGSVTSFLKIEADNQFEFVREPYTLWQNSAINPFNVLIVPIEETLHILVRPFTETAMQADLVRYKPTQLEQVQQVVDEWMVVEEAIVGGVVWQVMPEILTRFLHEGSPDLLADILTEREELPQYRLLRSAIQVVTDLGVNQAIEVYSNNPLDFRSMISLSNISASMESAQKRQPTMQID
ncbi:hypothetical protein [Desulfosarcina sp.]|uniref:hypothetical protein n=1 Tax=Desulfosarcina sp. TaxID=2027861 RepID=UPI0029A5B7FA|nr:hypothetical protein [Desulfosarcina sp.]MDX2452816.1 hypothetical protein [Desulfosarcina sp.]MDX2490560.1 hypothetical protein [Desulfosarcina sp.]